MTLVSAFAVLTVVNMTLAEPKADSENTLDMLEIMTRAFDESEGGEGGHTATYDCHDAENYSEEKTLFACIRGRVCSAPLCGRVYYGGYPKIAKCTVNYPLPN